MIDEEWDFLWSIDRSNVHIDLEVAMDGLGESRAFFDHENRESMVGLLLHLPSHELYTNSLVITGLVVIRMAVQSPRIMLPAREVNFPVRGCLLWRRQVQLSSRLPGRNLNLQISALSGGDNSSSGKKATAPNSNYVVPLDKSSCITRPLAEILRDLNKRIPDNIIKTQDDQSTSIPW